MAGPERHPLRACSATGGHETLLSLEGDDHHRLRRLLNPAFRSRADRRPDAALPGARQRAHRRLRGARAGASSSPSSPSRTPPGSSAMLLGLPDDGVAAGRATGPTTSASRFGVDVEQRPAADRGGPGRALRGYVDERRRRPQRAPARRPRHHAGAGRTRRRRPEPATSCGVGAGVPGLRAAWRPPATSSGWRCRRSCSTPTSGRCSAERPELGGQAVEEVMRVNPTVTWVTREASRTSTIQGLHIPRGAHRADAVRTRRAPTRRRSPRPGFDITARAAAAHGFGGGVPPLPRALRRPHRHERGAAAARAPAARTRASTAPANGCPLPGNTGPIRLPIAFTSAPNHQPPAPSRTPP